MSAAAEWAQALREWGIPSHILGQAPESPWIHPPAMFTVPDLIPQTPSHVRARECNPQSVLDVGCGGGIAAFAAAPPATRVIGVDHQQAMVDMFANNARERGLQCSTVLGDWPDVAHHTPQADVVTCHHVAYNVADIAPFLTALNAHAYRRVVIEVPETHPLASMTPAWQHFWNLERPTTPTAANLLDIARQIGFDAHIERWISALGRPQPFEDQVRHLRIRLCLSADRDPEIAQWLTANPPPAERALATIWWDI